MGSKILEWIQKKIAILFLFSLFLIKFIPFYYFPVANKYFSSHTLAKVLIILISIHTCLLYKKSNIGEIIKKSKILFLVINLYFISQSISIVGTHEVFLFWRAYHNLIISLLIFFISFLLVYKNQKNIILFHNFIIWVGVFLVFIEFSFFLFPFLLNNIFQQFAQKEIFDVFLSNIERGRYSLDLELELFFPFLIFSAFFRNNLKLKVSRVVIFTSSVCLIFLSIFSNFRSRVLMLGIVFIGICIMQIFKKDKKEAQRGKFLPLTFFVFCLIIVMFIALSVSNFINSFNVFDRFALKNEETDVETIDSRIHSYYKSIDLFYSSPIYGIGLGNYAYYYSYQYDFSPFDVSKQYRKTYAEYASSYPHNVIAQTLAETGFIGFSAYTILLAYIGYKDIAFIRKTQINDFNRNIGISCIISFWSLFVYMLFNPSSTIFTLGWFWFVRGIKEGIQYS